MEFTFLTRFIREVWEFTWPPVFNVIVLLGIAWWIVPAVMRQIIDWCRSQLMATQLTSDSAYTLLKRFELLKLVPVVATFSVVFALFLVQEVVLGVGYWIPGHVQFDVASDFVRNAEPAHVAELWARFPGAKNLGELVLLLSRYATHGQVDDVVKNSLSNLDEKIKNAYFRISTVKFYALWALLLVVVALRTGAPRCVAICRACACWLFIAILWAYNILVIVYLHDERSSLRSLVIYNAVVVHNPDYKAPTDDEMSFIRERLRYEFESGGFDESDWWYFEMIDHDFWYGAAEILGRIEYSDKEQSANAPAAVEPRR